VISEKRDIFHIDLAAIGPMKTATGRGIITEVGERRIKLYTLAPEPYHGSGSKKISINRFIELDDLFFEGLGLWQGEGSKSKGLYFCNSTLEILLHFLDFSEKRLGLTKKSFKVVTHVSQLDGPGDEVMKKWSSLLEIPMENFVDICIDPRINQEHVQIYFNSVVLVELLMNLHEKLKPLILSNINFVANYLRGIYAAEGSVILRRSGILHHLNVSSKDERMVKFLERCFASLGITPSKYENKSRNLPIHGWRNFKRFRELGIHTLHPEKRAKFERGFANYKRTNVLDGEEARSLILQQLTSGPKTYDELAAALGKARTTIQAHHIPILEREGKVKRVGKRGHASLWAIAEGKISQTPTFNRAPCAELTPCSCTCPTT